MIKTGRDGMGGLAKLSTRMVALLLKVCALSITLNTYTQKHRGGMGGLAKLSARMLCCTNFFPDVCSEHLHLQSSESGWVDLQNFQVVCALNTSGKVKILFDDRTKSDKNFVCSVGQKILGKIKSGGQ